MENQEKKYEMIMCVVNAGYAANVMDEARKVGVRGGTIVHARGTANKEAETFFHITIQPDKDLLILLVPARIKDDVLHVIYRSVGLDSAGQGIAFSIPVDRAVGLAGEETIDGK